MAELQSDLASGAGVEDKEAPHGMGAVLALLKDRLNPEAYAHLRNTIPNAEGMLSAFQNKGDAAGGGILDTVKAMAGKLFGQQDTGTPQDQPAGAGLSADQFKSLLPRLHDMVAGKLPPDVLAQIKQHLPGFGPAQEQSSEQ
jgi:uncharacterized protein (DUF2267 family)